MTEIYGYSRVSTGDRNHNLQIDALTEAGVPRKNIIQETISGSVMNKPKFTALLDQLQSGDKLVVWKIDRLGRSVRDALATTEHLDKAGVRIIITTLGIDMKTPAGKLVFGIMAQIAEFEREQIVERVTAGLAATKARGTVLGRRHTLTTHQRKEAARMVNEEHQSLATVAAMFGCARSVVHRAALDARTIAATV